MGLFKKKQHAVAVYDTRPRPGDKEQFEPYFIALCECGWVGLGRDTGEEALKDAYEHAPSNVSEVLQRPIG